MIPSRLLRACSSVLLAGLCVGCPAVYPELDTRIRPPPAGVALDPPPPDDVRWVRFAAAKIPPKTRDGRAWDQVLGSLPDPYAVLFVNDKELIRSPVATDTLSPDWTSGPRGNFVIGPEDELRVELWDDNQLSDQPIGVRDLGRPKADWDMAREIRVTFEAGGELTLSWEPARSLYGVGLWYELRTGACYVTRLLDRSPASRAGVSKGDQVLRIGSRHVSDMSTDEVRSAFGAIPTGGLAVMLRHKDGSTTETVLREGPIYALYKQRGNLD